MTLDDLVQQLRAAHGDALLGVVLYGSTAAPAASAAGTAAVRGHNVLVVVRSLDVAAMRADGAIGLAWQAAGHAVPLTLTAAEWRSSVDVFAIEHADIADRHRVLYASAGFAITPPESIKPDDLRRQLEYELLAQVLGVRAAITRAGTNHKAQRELLSAQANRAVAMMRTALRLAGRAPSSDVAAVCADAAAIGGFDPAPFVAAHRQRHGGGEIAKGELYDMLGGFHEGLSALLAHVDDFGKQKA